MTFFSTEAKKTPSSSANDDKKSQTHIGHDSSAQKGEFKDNKDTNYDDSDEESQVEFEKEQNQKEAGKPGAGSLVGSLAAGFSAGGMAIHNGMR